MKSSRWLAESTIALVGVVVFIASIAIAIGLVSRLHDNDPLQLELARRQRAVAQEWERRMAASEQQRDANAAVAGQGRLDDVVEVSEEEVARRGMREDPEGWMRSMETHDVDWLADIAVREFGTKLVRKYLDNSGIAIRGGPEASIRLPDLGTKENPLRRWLGRGTVETKDSSENVVSIVWELHLAHRNGKFLPAALFLDGSVVFEDLGYAAIARAAAAERKAEQRDESKRAPTTGAGAAKDAADCKSDEEKAATMLRAAELLIPVNKSAATRRLNQIVETFPETRAAEKAAKLLK